MILVSFWRYPDPDPYRLKRIRIHNTENRFRDRCETNIFQFFQMYEINLKFIAIDLYQLRSGKIFELYIYLTLAHFGVGSV